MDKEMLHDELDAIAQDPKRVYVRIVGHALIELGRVTAIECGWDKCKMETRLFIPDTNPEWKPQHRLGISFDHVQGRAQGGSDRPENLMLLHFGCNAAKGVIDYHKDPENKEKHAEVLRKRWADPAYRENVVAKATAANNRPEVAAKKSAAMKKAHANKTADERRAIAMKAWETRRSNADAAMDD